MQLAPQKITPCLWYNTEAEEAAKFYVSVFKDSRIGSVSHYANAGQDIHGKPAGSVMAVQFFLSGHEFVALNGGPHFKFDEAISFQVHCDNQQEINYFWSKLSEGGQEGPCGWLKDKFGLSWQVTPTALLQMLMDPDSRKVERVTRAFLQMQKFDIAALERVYRGEAA
jgi:predicted 3-demethylubiquinone-9 3-methyltransferase (glyoxalase superfamily)